MNKELKDFELNNLNFLLEEIEGVELKAKKTVSEFHTNKELIKYSKLANEVEWHIKGLAYHYKNMLDHYANVSEKLYDRVNNNTNVGIVIFHSLEMQSLLFEFYSIVSLARITLDYVTQYTLAPLFKPGTLPGSVNKFMKGKSNINLHQFLNDQKQVRYLIDLRDCMVHFRTFATGENTMAFADGFDIDQLPNIEEYWKHPVVRTFFRKVDNNTISINLLLPDHIYSYSETGARMSLVGSFEYSSRINILRQSLDFIHLCEIYSLSILNALKEKDHQLYEWQKQ